QTWRAQLAQSEQQLEKLMEGIRGAPAAEALVRDLEQAIARGDYAPELRAEIDRLSAELKALAYDETEHRRLHAESGKLEGGEREMVALEQAERGAPLAEAELAEATGLLAARQQVIAADQIALAEADRHLAAAAEVDTQAARLGSVLAEAD